MASITGYYRYFLIYLTLRDHLTVRWLENGGPGVFRRCMDPIKNRKYSSQLCDRETQRDVLDRENWDKGPIRASQSHHLVVVW